MLAKQKLIEDNMKLVYALISKEYPTYLHDEDIIQCGMLGLCKAAEKYDESKSKFSTYAYFAIRTEIQMEFRRRAKHQGVLSLDYPYKNDRGEDGVLADFIVGDEDVSYIDLDVDYSQLTPKEQEIYELKKRGMSQVEVARALGVHQSTVSKVMRKIKKLRG